MKRKSTITKALLGGGLALLLVFAYVGPAEAQSCLPPPSGLLSWWDADSVSGTTAFDIQGVNDGTMVGGVAIVAGQVGNAFSFDGVNDFIQLGFDAGIFTNHQFTIDAWAFPTKLRNQAFLQGIFDNFPPTGRGITLAVFEDSPLRVAGAFWNTDPIQFLVGGGPIPIETIPNQWHHYALTYDGAELCLYQDGDQEECNPASGDIIDNNVTFRIGHGQAQASDQQRFFGGLIDEVEIFNRALTQTEIQGIFNAGDAGKCKKNDHFLCYKAEETDDDVFDDDEDEIGVLLSDQFEVDEFFEVEEPRFLCNPADKNGEGIADEETHLVGYKIERENDDDDDDNGFIQKNVQVDNQFGTIFVDVKRPDRLLVPSSKDLDELLDPPDPEAHNVDHFKCYKVRKTPGTEKFEPITVTLNDQFDDTPKEFKVIRPRRLCTPVDKNGEGFKNPDNHLMCYRVRKAVGEPRHQRVKGIFINNQFGPEQLDTIRAKELCVPSEKTLP